VRFFHRPCAVLSGGGGRDFVFSFLPPSPPPSAAVPHPLSVAVFSFSLSFFPLSSGVVVQPSRVRSALPSRPPLAFFLPLPSRRSRFYGGAQFRFFPSPICRPSFLHSSDAPHQGLPHRPSYPSTPSLPRSSHHAPPRGLHAPARGSHAPSRPPRAGASSSPANLGPPCPPPLLSGLFFCFFYFLCIVIFLYLYFYLYFVGCNLPAVLWFDPEEEIVVGGRLSASLWFFVVLALQLSFHRDGCFTRIGLFTEFLCILHRLVRPWNRPGLLMILFESLANTIACCSILWDRIQYLSLYLHYLLSFGFVVGEPTPCLFSGSLTFSSVWIRSGKDPSL
jgi:hypothetical protein